ncbi:unnamed protein product [Orchesella dallaii]|uniref:G-protein coupled receptors family 1 profile domain-containing protein n=1 Tax=Orchesella dallaii TaxID=48710 RepID=A0ABP1PTA0_9HEXA
MNKTKFASLNFWTCYFLDSEDGTYPTMNPHFAFKCRAQGKFLSKNEEYGHAICIFITVLIFLVGICGFVTNVLNVFVLRKSLKGSSLKNLLIILAVFEFAACIFAMSFSTVILIILENVSRNEVTILFFKAAHILFSLGRTGAICITILVSIERYLVIAFPVESKAWLSPTRSILYILSAISVAILLNISYFTNTTVIENNVSFSPNTTLANFPYILNGTEISRKMPHQMKFGLMLMNYVAPFPFLLIFNGLLYKAIYSWNKNRKGLSGKQKREIGTAKMFSVVVLILLLCHTVSCIIFFLCNYLRTIYRELLLLQLLSVTLSAAINFLVYFAFGKAFREEFWKLMTSWRLFGRQKFYTAKPQETQSTQTSRDSSSGTLLRKGKTKGEKTSTNGNKNGTNNSSK